MERSFTPFSSSCSLFYLPSCAHRSHQHGFSVTRNQSESLLNKALESFHFPFLHQAYYTPKLSWPSVARWWICSWQNSKVFTGKAADILRTCCLCYLGLNKLLSISQKVKVTYDLLNISLDVKKRLRLGKRNLIDYKSNNLASFANCWNIYHKLTHLFSLPWNIQICIHDTMIWLLKRQNDSCLDD